MLVDRISRTNNSTDPAHRLFRLVAASTLGRQLTVEFIGTFILVLTVGLSTSTKGAGDLAPLSDRVSTDGDGVRRRAYLGRPLQPRRELRRAARRQAQPTDRRGLTIALLA